MDGWTHEDEAIQKKDIKKQRDLEAAGYNVLRFTNFQVMNELIEVKLGIEEWIEDFENSVTSPYPPSKGEWHRANF